MTLLKLSNPRWLLSSLLIAGATMFAIGVAAERHASAHHTETGSETMNAAEATTDQTAVDGETGGGATHADETTGRATTRTETPGSESAEHAESTGHFESSGETVLGLNLESNAPVIVAVAVSVALAALTWLRNLRRLLLPTMFFGLAFAIFDIDEVAHQTTESRTGLAILASAIALVHVVTAVVAK